MATKQTDKTKVDIEKPIVAKEPAKSFDERTQDVTPWKDSKGAPAAPAREPIIVPENERRSEEAPEAKPKSVKHRKAISKKSTGKKSNKSVK